MKFVSLKSKILFALTVLTAVVMLAQTLVAKSVFEKDKIATIFDLAIRDSKAKAESLNEQLGSLLTVGRSLVLSYDFSKNEFSEAGNFLFSQSTQVIGLVLQSPGPTSNQDLIRQEKSSQLLENRAIQTHLFSKMPDDIPTQLLPIDTKLGTYLISTPIVDSNTNQKKRLILVLSEPSWTSLFADSNGKNSLLLGETHEVIAGGLAPQLLAEVQQQISSKKLLAIPDQASMLHLSGQDYIVSSSRMPQFSFSVLSFVDKATAFESLSGLYRKSAVFFFLMTALIVMLSLLIAKSITQNLEKLRTTTEEIGTGNFDANPDINSNDEFGLLAGAISKMTGEIKRLLIETVEKTRMAGELATARTVQETLFPANDYSDESVWASGYYQSASECGGDWWFYEKKGPYFYVIVADATGHGAPAALITSAARSAFSVVMEQSPPEASELARLLNKAIFETSKGRILMTAFLARIEVTTGRVTYVNASHEPPMIINRDSAHGKKLLPRFLIDPVAFRLGADVDHEFIEGRTQMSPGDVLFIHTDGLTDLVGPTEEAFGERRLHKGLATEIRIKADPKSIIQRVITDCEVHQCNSPLVDDVTAVAISLKA